jgi:hypothetical protein
MQPRQKETNVLKSETGMTPATESIDKGASLDRSNPSRLSSKLLRSELAEIRKAWGEYQKTRTRDGVYQYLDTVYGLVGKWTRLQCAKSRARRALALQNIRLGGRVEPFAAVINCTAGVHRRTVSKWSRALQYAAEVKQDREELADFIKRNGGINDCASKFSRAGSQSRKISR